MRSCDRCDGPVVVLCEECGVEDHACDCLTEAEHEDLAQLTINDFLT